MTNIRIVFADTDVLLPDGYNVGVMGEHNAVQLAITLPPSMVTGMSFHTVTVNDTESAPIVERHKNVDGAYRFENTLYFPLTAAYTAKSHIDLFVTAYRQTGDVAEIIDKTSTVYGLLLKGCQSHPIPGGLVAEVAHLADEINAMRDDIPSAQEVESWNMAADKAHEHFNMEALTHIGSIDNFYSPKLAFWGNIVGIETVDYLPITQVYGKVVYLNTSDKSDTGLWINLSDRPQSTEWYQICTAAELEAMHTHSNKEVLDNLTWSTYPTGQGTLLYNGTPVCGIPIANAFPPSPNKYQIMLNTTDETLYRLTDGDRIAIASAATVAAIPDLENKKHSHPNGTTLGKLSESDGKLLFDGKEVGDIVDVVDTPSLLVDGEVGVAAFDEEPEHLNYTSPLVGVDIAGMNLVICDAKYNETAIESAIEAQSLPTISVDGRLPITGSIMPVVEDISDNEYVDAGITLDPDATIVATGTKKYAVALDWSEVALDIVKSDKIIEVDSSHIQVPISAIFAFEDLTTADSDELSTGWNLILMTLDSSTYEPTAVEFLHVKDLNDYIYIDTQNDSTIIGDADYGLFEGVFDLYPVTKEKGVYAHGDEWQRIDDVQDVAPLGFSAYYTLVVRDNVSNDSIQDVPVYSSASGEIVRLEAANEDYISLSEDTQDDGMPIRYLTVKIGSSTKVYYPVDKYSSGSVVVPKGWSANGTATSAPDLTLGFAPDCVVYGGARYCNENFSPEVQAAVNSLSQCINVSATALGHINVPDDAVVRFNGKIEPNRKYFFTTGTDCAFTIFDVPFSKKDAQFVIYLTCTSDVDLAFPSDVLFNGTINSDTGTHKIFGSWDKVSRKWCVGGVDYEVAE